MAHFMQGSAMPGAVAHNSSHQANFKTYRLKQGQELRLIVDPNNKVRVWVISGDCEIFGSELKVAQVTSRKHRAHHHSQNRTPNDYDIGDSYVFCDCSIAIFSSGKQGANLLVQGTPSHDYISDQV